MRMKNLCTADVIANHRFKTEPCVQKPVCSNTQSFFLPIFHRFTHIFLIIFKNSEFVIETFNHSVLNIYQKDNYLHLTILNEPIIN